MKQLAVLILSLLLINAKYYDCIKKESGTASVSIQPDGLWFELNAWIRLKLEWQRLPRYYDRQQTKWEVWSLTFDKKWMSSPYMLECDNSDDVLLFYGELAGNYREKLFEVKEWLF